MQLTQRTITKNQPAGTEKENLGMAIFSWPKNNSVTNVGNYLRPWVNVNVKEEM